MAAEGASHLLSAVTLLGSAVLAVPLFIRLGLGSVLGYLAAGLVIGPFGFKLFENPNSIMHTAELGVVMFLFIIGLEMKPSHLWGLRKQIFGLGALQVFASGAFVMCMGKFLGFSWQTAFVIAAGFVLSSTAIIMQLLSDRKEMSSPHGQKIISVLLFEDLLIVPLLAIIAFLSPLEVVENAAPMWQKIGIGVGALAILIVSGIWLLNPLFKALAWTKLREMMTAAALLVVLGAAYLMELSGLSSAMGAFIAGVLLSNSSFRHQLEADIEPFRGLLLGLFFLGVGMSLDLNLVFTHLGFILLCVFGIMFASGLAIFLVAIVTKTKLEEALSRAFTMAMGGEFAFVLFSAAATQGVITNEVRAEGVSIIVLSMVFAPLFLMGFTKFILPRLPKAEEEEREPDHIDEIHPIIMVGFGRFGQIINEVLTMTNHKVTIIDRDEEIITGMRKLGVKAYYGNAERPEMLHHAGIESARMLIVTSGNKEKCSHIVQLARKMNPNITILARAYDVFHVFDLFDKGANRQIREAFDSALRTARYALEELGGLNQEKIDEIARVYYEENRHRLRLMAEVHDPKYTRKFENKKMIEVAQKSRQEVALLIQQIMQRED